MCFSNVGLRSMSQMLFRKNFVVVLVLFSELILIKLQMCIMTISRTSWHFSLVDAISRSQLHIA